MEQVIMADQMPMSSFFKGLGLGKKRGCSELRVIACGLRKTAETRRGFAAIIVPILPH
jgi:hypothetical protein